MAITQKHKVEFMVTSVLPTDVEQDIAKDLIKLAKSVSNGETHRNGVLIDQRQKRMLSLFVEGGMEAVSSFLVRTAIRESIREIRDEYSAGECFKLSPASVRKVGV